MKGVLVVEKSLRNRQVRIDVQRTELIYQKTVSRDIILHRWQTKLLTAQGSVAASPKGAIDGAIMLVIQG